MKTKFNSKIHDPQDWNSYWDLANRNRTHPLYNLIAEFYRKFIIRPNLNKYIRKFFSPLDTILHAGCGSGQVDLDIATEFSITALDISPAALELYKKHNPSVRNLINGSIFDLPKNARGMDGIYNLGVMEHFSEIEIQSILKQFHESLNDDGIIILFWPHRLGSSVIFLKFVHKILNLFSKNRVALHPPEITYMSSRQQAVNTLQKNGFTLVEYSFSLSDLFTQAIVVGKKT